MLLYVIYAGTGPRIAMLEVAKKAALASPGPIYKVLTRQVNYGGGCSWKFVAVALGGLVQL